MPLTSTREDAVTFLAFVQRGSALESSVGDDPSGLRTVEKVETTYIFPRPAALNSRRILGYDSLICNGGYGKSGQSLHLAETRYRGRGIPDASGGDKCNLVI